MLHSIAVANLFAHNNISQICYCGQISLHSTYCSFSDNLTPLGVTFIVFIFMKPRQRWDGNEDKCLLCHRLAQQRALASHARRRRPNNGWLTCASPVQTIFGVLFENSPALYFFFFNYTFISAYKIYFLFRIKDTVSDILSVLLNFIAN